MNFLSLLGWHPGHDEEIMSMNEMIEKFEITDIHKSGAVLDPIKLDWMNGEYIKRLDPGELHTRVAKHLEEYEEDFYKNTFSQKNYDFNHKIIKELQTRMKRFDEYVELTKCLYGSAGLRIDLLMNPKMKIETTQEAIDSLQFALPILENADFTNLDKLKSPFIT